MLCCLINIREQVQRSRLSTGGRLRRLYEEELFYRMKPWPKQYHVQWRNWAFSAWQSAESSLLQALQRNMARVFFLVIKHWTFFPAGAPALLQDSFRLVDLDLSNIDHLRWESTSDRHACPLVATNKSTIDGGLLKATRCSNHNPKSQSEKKPIGLTPASPYNIWKAVIDNLCLPLWNSVPPSLPLAVICWLIPTVRWTKSMYLDVQTDLWTWPCGMDDWRTLFYFASESAWCVYSAFMPYRCKLS